MTDFTDRSASGNPIIRYPDRESQWQPAAGDTAIGAIEAHVEKHIGRTETVLHEIASHLVHVDVLVVAPASDRNWWTLVTSGMSDLPMTTPPQGYKYRYAELMLSLPASWPVIGANQVLTNDPSCWPIHLLRWLARFPHEYKTWFGWGHTISNGDPAQPFSHDTELCGTTLLQPCRVPDEFGTLQVSPDKTIHFWAPVPLYREEMDFKLRHGAGDLVDRLGEAGVTELIDPQRKNVCKP